MKKLLTSLLLLGAVVSAHATIHTVTVSNNQYTPSNLTINGGDTVRFMWTAGTHPTASDNGAWSTFPMDNQNTQHDVVLNTPGSYPYHCEFHGAAGGIGMAGTITVTALSAPALKADVAELKVYPNPASEQISISHNLQHVDYIKITNLIGQEMKNVKPAAGAAGPYLVSIADLPKGMYFVNLQSKGSILMTRRVIKDR